MIWPDVIAGIVVLLLAVAGLRRGFWSELLYMLGVGLAIVMSAWLTPKLSHFLPGSGGAFGRIESWIAFYLLFAVFAGAAGFLTRKSGDAVPEGMRGVDRGAGFLLGALRGVMLAGFFYWLLIQPPVPAAWKSQARQAHFAAASLSFDAVALTTLSGGLPVLRPYARMLEESLRRLRSYPPGTLIVQFTMERHARS